MPKQPQSLHPQIRTATRPGEIQRLSYRLANVKTPRGGLFGRFENVLVLANSTLFYDAGRLLSPTVFPAARAGAIVLNNLVHTVVCIE